MIQLRDYNKEERTALAKVFYPRISEAYAKEIESSIANTIRYPMLKEESPIDRKYDTKIHLIDTDSVSCLFNNVPEDGRTAVLNFASFKHPGGMFLNGSSAQEESLCHQSTLYPVLCAFKDEYYIPHKSQLNNGLYNDDLLYSKDIVFFDFTIENFIQYSMEGTPYVTYKTNRTRHADVITCAAPNAKAFYRRHEQPYVPFELNCTSQLIVRDSVRSSLNHRCAAVLLAAYNNGVENLILGAYGCGVFGNDPCAVADTFLKYLHFEFKNCFKNVYFPIPKDRTGNFEAFQKFDGIYEKFDLVLMHF